MGVRLTIDSFWSGLALSLVLVVLAALLNFLLWDVVKGSPYLFPLAAVVVSAWFGGRWAGLMSAIALACLSLFFFLEPRFSFRIDLTELPRLGMFLTISVVIAMLAGARQRAMFRFIHEREALAESEARTRAILDTTVDGIITIDERGVVETFNTAAERLFGYRAHEVLGRNVGMLMPQPDRSEHDDYIQKYLDTGRPQIIGIGREVVGMRKDGSTFPMDLAVSEVHLGGRRIFTGVVRDLTDRKRMERELLEISDREQRRIGQDLHDGLGQVLAGVGFMASSLQQRLASRSAPESDDARQIAELMSQAISQARGMARGLHPVRQIETGLMTALEELASSISQMYRISCTFCCEEAVTMSDASGAIHVYRIAQEAVNNAIKHGKARRITITLTRDDSHATLTVADDGVGFAEAPVTRKGMGLHIMRYRAAMVGATMAIRRGAAGGTFVTCSFPLK